MFEFNCYQSADSAVTGIVNYLKAFKWKIFDSNSEFSLTHSVNQSEIITETITYHDLFENLLDFVRDIDAQEGIYCDNDEGLDFDESNLAQDRIYREMGEKYIALAGEGILVIKNSFSSAPGDYIFIVTKPSLYRYYGKFVIETLRNQNLADDYTSKIVPALYVQLGFSSKV